MPAIADSRAHTAPPPASPRLSESCGPKQEEFLNRCFYTAGQYDDAASFQRLSAEMEKHEGGRKANRIFYLSVPPSVFVAVAQNAARSAASKTGARRDKRLLRACAHQHH